MKEEEPFKVFEITTRRTGVAHLASRENWEGEWRHHTTITGVVKDDTGG